MQISDLRRMYARLKPQLSLEDQLEIETYFRKIERAQKRLKRLIKQIQRWEHDKRADFTKRR